MWPFKKKKIEQPVPPPQREREPRLKKRYVVPRFEQPTGSAYAQDGALKAQHIGDDVARHFAERSYIGPTLIAHIATNWLVDKACSEPARDAVRQGWEVQCEFAPLEEVAKKLDEKRDIKGTLERYVTMARVYGGQLALFDIAAANPEEFYENPFNLDGVSPGTYRGIILIDPPDAMGQLTEESSKDPTHPRYMQPTYWIIGGRRYHWTHFAYCAPYPVPRIARQRHNYFGVSVPERIADRVYAAERIADETIALAATKRITAMQIAGLANAAPDTVEDNLEYMKEFRDNFGILILDEGASVQQLDTSLGGLDELVMTHYQLAAAAANVPASKLLETTPKGFNATGNYEAASYRERLESIQTSDMSPLLQRHYELVAAHHGRAGDVINFQWEALDSPTAQEYMQIEMGKMQVAQGYHAMGVIDAPEIRERLADDKESAYYGLKKEDIPDEPPNLPSWSPNPTPSLPS